MTASKSSTDSILSSLERINQGINIYLKAQYSIEQGYVGRTFYGETFTAAALQLADIDPEWQQALIDSYVQKEQISSSRHAEFNLYALQFCEPTTQVIKLLNDTEWHQRFYRKVTNWVLLRSLVKLRRGNKLSELSGWWQARVYQLVNRYQGYLTDNTLRSFYKRKVSTSDQYHAFAAMLQGELVSEQRNLKYADLEDFLQNVEFLRGKINSDGSVIEYGRGQKQIFGYAAFLYSLVQAYHFTQQEEYLRDFARVLAYVESFQTKTGKIPLVLTQHDPQPFLYSYNNELDYLPFLYFYLVRSYVELGTETR